MTPKQIAWTVLGLPTTDGPTYEVSQGKQAAAAVGSRQKRGIPVTVGRPAAGHEHHAGEGTAAFGLDQCSVPHAGIVGGVAIGRRSWS